MDATFANAKRKPEKKFWLVRAGFECLCDTGAALLPIELTGNWFFLIHNQWVVIYAADSPIHLSNKCLTYESVMWPSSAFAAQ